MNAHGRVACLNATDGKEVWAVNALERFAGKHGPWGFGECLLVDGPRVVVTPGGKKAVMAALDRDTGKTLWTTPPIPEDGVSYASPILIELAGRRQIVSYSSKHVFGVDAAKGTLLWRLPWSTAHMMIGPMPVLDGDAVLASASSRAGGMTARIRLQPTAKGVEAKKLWAAPVDDLHGTSVLLNSRLYLSGHRTHKGWACLDTRTGKILYRSKDRVEGSVIYADGRLYCLSQDGFMSLIEPTDAGFRTRGRFRLVEKKSDVWAHPVVCGRRLYLRYHDTLYCYDIARK
jgi:outer membrane protein assembly factor BamB